MRQLHPFHPPLASTMMRLAQISFVLIVEAEKALTPLARCLSTMMSVFIILPGQRTHAVYVLSVSGKACGYSGDSRAVSLVMEKTEGSMSDPRRSVSGETLTSTFR